jgi:transposase InsO family protein
MTEMFLFRISQKKGFVKEFSAFQKSEEINLKNSQLKDYNPRWDCKKRLIISESRLTQSDLPEDTKRPIILPKNCEIVDKFVQYLHEIEGHSGPEHILSVVRQKFRLIQGRRQIRRILHKCLKRGCVKPTPLTQQMAPLPSERTNDQAAFRHTAVDLFGPLFAKHWCQFDKCPHPPQTKVYGALFTCFHSRAVHLELIRDQGTEEFMAAFRSFVGRRGTPNTMYSDNAKNFKSACKEIRSLYRSINWSKVKETGLINKIDWQFSTERAPWTNAICERMVRSVKAPLRIILGSANLTYRQLSVILTEVEGIVNNRPLSLVTDHPDDLIPITPAELIIGRKMNQLPDPNIQHNETNIVHLWRKRQATLNSFWKRWRNDYLLAQDVRKKWRTPSHENLVNKLVLIRDDNMARNEWKFGKITDTVKSKDGLIRTVVVKTPTSMLRRPIQRISLFENI